MDYYTDAAAEPGEEWIATERAPVVRVELSDDTGNIRGLTLSVDAAAELVDALADALAEVTA